MESYDDILALIMSLVSCLTAVITTIAGVIMAYNKLKKAVKGDADAVESMKTDFTILREATSDLLDNYKKLEETIAKKDEEIELLVYERDNGNEKE